MTCFADFTVPYWHSSIRLLNAILLCTSGSQFKPALQTRKYELIKPDACQTMPRRKSIRELVKNRVHLTRLFGRASKCRKEALTTNNDSRVDILIDEESTDSIRKKEVHLDVQIDTVVDVDECIRGHGSEIEIAADEDIASIVCLSVDDEDNALVETSPSDDTGVVVCDYESADDDREEAIQLVDANDSELALPSYTNNERNTTSSTVPQRLPKIYKNKDGFDVDDLVKVIGTHKKHAGKRGKVVKTTNKFVFFKVDDTLERVQISPKFLEHSTHVCQYSDESTIYYTSDSFASDSDMIKETLDVQTSSRRDPLTIEPGDSIQVSREHSKHGGKTGTVEKTTVKFASIVVDGTNEKFRIMKSSLIPITSLHGSTSSTEEEDKPYGATSPQRGPKLRKSINTIIPTKISQRGKSSSKVRAISQPSSIIPQRLERLCYGTSYVKEITLLGLMLGDKLTCEYDSINTSLDPVYYREDGKRYELYYTDVVDDQTKASMFNRPKKVMAHYVQTDNLRELEESLADFGSLHPRKVWARRKLFLSKAAKLGRGYAFKDILATDATVHDSTHTAGCGFICEKFLVELLGSDAAAKRALGIQVRICIPTLGVFKGILLRKSVTTGPPIQLNESLRKIGASRCPSARKSGYMIINRVFPSTSNLQVARLFPSYEGRPVTKSFMKELKAERECKFSIMYRRLLQGLGVPTYVMEEYLESYKAGKGGTLPNVCHTHLVGFADPTEELPPNTVYVTGIKHGDIDVRSVLISRSPAMEPYDCRKVRVITTKPQCMSQKNWDWLQTLHFGGLIFASPKEGQRPLPELIADGDLDGDLYFVCWNSVLLSHAKPLPITGKDLECLDGETRISSYNEFWFEEAQNFVSSTSDNIVSIAHLTGCLYNASVYERTDKKVPRKNRQIKSIHDPDAVAFARAYKEVLEFKKHGGKIRLPKHLWVDIPERLHSLLCSGDE